MLNTYSGDVEDDEMVIEGTKWDAVHFSHGNTVLDR